MRALRKILTAIVALAVLLGMTACFGTPEEKADRFLAWLVDQPGVISAETGNQAGTWGPTGLLALVKADGGLTSDEMVALADSIRSYATFTLGEGSAIINLRVGDDYGLSVDGSGQRVRILAELRDDPAFTGALLKFKPYLTGGGGGDNMNEFVATVADGATIAESYARFLEITRDHIPTIDGEYFKVQTESQDFYLQGYVDDRDPTDAVDGEPVDAIALWQAIAARVDVSSARMVVNFEGVQDLLVFVAAEEDIPTAESFGPDYPKVDLIVRVKPSS